MIPVTLQPEPSNFNETVRKPGLKWLHDHGIDPQSAPPKASDLHTYWRNCLHDLWKSYSGICAYLAIYIDCNTGSATVDHFIPISKNAGKAYEWNNFRLSALGPNRNKNRFDDILDPFELKPETFHLETVSGEIYPNRNFPNDYQQLAQKTIDRLKLNAPNTKDARQKYYREYIEQHIDSDYMQRYYPFVWAEIVRQEKQASTKSTPQKTKFWCRIRQLGIIGCFIYLLRPDPSGKS